MKLVVGLGNPGSIYDKTRHNIGFMFLDNYSSSFKINKKFNAKEAIISVNSDKVILIKPLSFMNLSGGVVRKYVDYYNILPSDILVIQDDLDMPIGCSKILYNRGDGGHNGIKDIIKCVNTKEFYRLKIGISNDKMIDTKDYVLGKFLDNEMKIIDTIFNNLHDIIFDFVSMKSDSFIQKYNTRVDK